MSFTHWLSNHLGLSKRPASRRKTPAARPTSRPTLEALEDRWVPSTLTVQNNLDSGAGSAFCFSLDESFDVGEDTGTPVVEDYADKMPFKFTGKLNKLVIELKPKQGDPPPQKPPFRD